MPGQQAPTVNPQPTPQTWTVQAIPTDNGKQLVMVVFNGHCGAWVNFLAPHAAKNLAAQIEAAATQAETGLIIAGAQP